jgi:hypothetical protein
MVIVAAGILLWLIERFVPMEATMRMILRAVVVIIIIVWLLKISGLWNALMSVRI